MEKFAVLEEYVCLLISLGFNIVSAWHIFLVTRDSLIGRFEIVIGIGWVSHYFYYSNLVC